MESLYVIEPGCYLRREGAALHVCKGKQVVDRIPADGLKKLTLVGYVSLTGGVLDFLISRQVETVFLTTTGRFRARLGGDVHRHVELRRAQYLKLGGAGAAAVAAGIVSGKLENMARFLIARGRKYGDDALRVAAARIRSIRRICDADTPDLDRLRGLEGAGTRFYYGTFGGLLKNPDFRFNGRNRRPPLDPVNALMSFVYTLLTNEVLSAVKAVGLDPYMGALHEISYGRPSLACDLVEEYRCRLGDRMVLGLINRKMLSPEDFTYRKDPPENFVDEKEMKEKRPVEMKPHLMKTFIASYEEMMGRETHYPPDDCQTSYRQVIHRQAAKFAGHLLDDGKVYKPFIWEH
ncbi:CRISPR-associated endonuclease Cas1 [Desulfococcus sp.]|uniref:CRISPR-associated endonuclease Cas1 n=1 Tax=Desulfococcus sp. TaxID=2025834 RepID=UPI003592F558